MGPGVLGHEVGGIEGSYLGQSGLAEGRKQWGQSIPSSEQGGTLAFDGWLVPSHLTAAMPALLFFSFYFRHLVAELAGTLRRRAPTVVFAVELSVRRAVFKIYTPFVNTVKCRNIKCSVAQR